MFPAFSQSFSNQHSTSLKANNHPIIPMFGANSNKAAQQEIKNITRETVDEFMSSNKHVQAGQVNPAKKDLINTFGHPDRFSSDKAERSKREATGKEVANTARSFRTSTGKINTRRSKSKSES